MNNLNNEFDYQSNTVRAGPNHERSILTSVGMGLDPIRKFAPNTGKRNGTSRVPYGTIALNNRTGGFRRFPTPRLCERSATICLYSVILSVSEESCRSNDKILHFVQDDNTPERSLRKRGSLDWCEKVDTKDV